MKADSKVSGILGRFSKTLYLMSISGLLTVGFVTSFSGCAKGGSGGVATSDQETHDEKLSGDMKKTAPHALPPVTDLRVRSGDRVKMDTLMARAVSGNKTVILEVGAAWCGPCMMFSNDMDKHPEYLRELTSQGVIFARAETEKGLEGYVEELSDFLPMLVKFYPTFYAYTANGGWQALGAKNYYSQLKTAIANLNVHLDPIAASDFESSLNKIGSAAQGAPETKELRDRYFNSLDNPSATYGYGDFKTILEVMKRLAPKYPSLELKETAERKQQSSLFDYVAMGGVTLQALAKDFPVQAAELTDVSNQRFSSRLFQFQLFNMIHESGIQKTAAACESTWSALRNQYTPGSLSQADYKKRLATLNASAAAVCTQLHYQVEGPTTHLKDRFAVIDAIQPVNWVLQAALGDREKAAQLYNKDVAKMFESLNKRVATLTENLQKAIDSKVEKDIAEARLSLEVAKYQIDWYKAVDLDVEDAVRTGRALEILTVYN